MVTLDDFISEAHRFVSAHYPRLTTARSDNSAQYGVIPEKAPEVEAVELSEALAWRKKAFDAGFGWIEGPTAYGGRGLPTEYANAFKNVERQYAVPDEAYTRFSVSILCPTLATHATDEFNDQFLSALRRTDLVSCQLFSEPDAGSDMASTRTFARREGSDWIVNGQKVWTSSAHYSEVGLLLARTDRNSRRNAGLTTFLIDMDQPGIEVRPIKQLSGGASFSEVFLHDAVVPDARRIGAIDDGWSVIRTTMLHERAAIGVDGGVDLRLAEQLVTLAHNVGKWGDKVVQHDIATAYVHARSNQLLTRKYADAAEKTGVPGAEMSLAKVLLTDNLNRIESVAQDLIGDAFVADTSESDLYAWNQLSLTIPGLRIGGGTDEIMRDIVAQRVLGLPR